MGRLATMAACVRTTVPIIISHTMYYWEFSHSIYTYHTRKENISSIYIFDKKIDPVLLL